VVEGETGLLVPPQDMPALSNALCRLIEDRALATQLSVRSRVRFERYFTINRMIEAHVEVYESLALAWAG